MDIENEKNVPEWINDLINDEHKFWNEKYPLLSRDEKLRHWSGTLHQNMRWQSESGLDPYKIFSREWLNDVKKVENDFDAILEDIFAIYWKDCWDKNEIKRRLEF